MLPPVGRNWQLIYPYRTIHLAQFNAVRVSFSALFTFLVGWHASAVKYPPGDFIFGWLACPLNDIIFCLYEE
jgi:hypothetical protein